MKKIINIFSTAITVALIAWMMLSLIEVWVKGLNTTPVYNSLNLFEIIVKTKM